MLLNVAHGVIDGLAHVGRFRKREQVIEARFGCQKQNDISVICGGVIHPGATPRRGWEFLQPGTLRRKSDFSEPKKDEAKDWLRVFRSLEAGVGAELVGGIPETLFKRVIGGVFF